MSKIELTEEQATKLHAAWISGGIGRAGAYSSIINEAVNMGLVRPATDDLAKDMRMTTKTISLMMDASDDLAARVAALEAMVDAPQQVTHATLNAVSLREISVCANALDGVTRMTQPDQTTRITETAAYWSKKLRELVDKHMRFGADVVAEAMTPDPHAAAKERAKLWGVELVEAGTDLQKQGKWLFQTKTHYYDTSGGGYWVSHDEIDTPLESMYGYYHTPSEAWSNFPTVPPPGYVAKDDYPADVLKACPQARAWQINVVHEKERGVYSWAWKAGNLYWHDEGNSGTWMDTPAHWGSRTNALAHFPTVPPPGWEGKRETIYVSPNGNDANGGKTIETPKQTVAAALGKPRTEADRLERLAEVAFHTMFEEEALAFNDQSPSRKRDWRKVALAVRKAVLAAQLEPSEEEVRAAIKASAGHDFKETIRLALIAAARVRLAKAEGER